MTEIASSSVPAPAPRSLLPGLALVALVTAAAFALPRAPFLAVLSPMILAILVGMAFNNLAGTPEAARDGIAFAGKRLLRVAVALLGVQLTFAELGAIGVAGIAILAAAVVSTFAFTLWIGRLLDVPRPLCELIAAGTSICGASAIAAANSVTRADEEDVSYAVACITLFGTVAMFLFPLVVVALELGPQEAGLWIGAAIHEVAQVVGAAFQGGEAAGEAGIVAKLARVMMLAPMIVVLARLAARRRPSPAASEGAGHPPLVPAFILAFLALTAANSLGLVPQAVETVLVTASPILLTAALGALGLGTDFGKLMARGIRPLLLAGAASLFIASASLSMVVLFG